MDNTCNAPSSHSGLFQLFSAIFDVAKELAATSRAYQRRVPMFIPRWGQWRKLADTSRNTHDERGALTWIHTSTHACGGDSIPTRMTKADRDQEPHAFTSIFLDPWVTHRF